MEQGGLLHAEGSVLGSNQSCKGGESMGNLCSLSLSLSGYILRHSHMDYVL